MRKIFFGVVSFILLSFLGLHFLPKETEVIAQSTGCWDCASSCCSTPTYYGGEGCMPCPTQVPTSPPSGCQGVGEECMDGLGCCSGLDCSNGVCLNRTPTMPWATPTPLPTALPPTATPVPCEPNDNNVCNRGTSYSGFFCERTSCGLSGKKTVRSSTNYDCYLDGIDCSVISGIWDTGNCPISNSCTCSSILVQSQCTSAGCYWDFDYCTTMPGATQVPVATQGPTPTTYCQPYQCQNVGSGNLCTIGGTPAFSIGGCGTASRCDNCRGTACMWCGGSTPAPQPTSVGTTCEDTASCLSDPRYATTCVNSTYTLCGGSVVCYGGVGTNCGAECSQYLIGSTYTSPNGCGLCNGCNNRPQVTSGSLIIKNSIGTVVGAESGMRNHICQTTFQNTILNTRRVRFEVSVTDADGWNTISNTGILRWNNTNYTLTKLSGSGVGGTMYVDIDFPIGAATGIESIYVTITDTSGGTTGQIDTNRDFKSWNCQVNVSGGVFDGSASGSVCTTTTGYSVPVDGAFNFRSLRFTRTDNGVKTSASVSVPFSYNISPNYLTWGRSYNTIEGDFNFNVGDGELAGTFPLLRISGGNITPGFYRCGPINLSNATMIDPYSNVTSLVVDFSSTVDQEAWWQVMGGGIKTNSTLTNMIPVTCTGTCRSAMSVNDTSLSNSNALVAAASIDNNSGCGSNCRAGYPDDRYYEGATLNENFSYLKLRGDFFVKYGEGREITGAGDHWSTIKADTTNKVFFVNGNLSINSNNTLANNAFMMVVASGTITIEENVTQIGGIFIANGGIVAAGDSSSQLVVSGMLHTSSGNVSLTRSYSDSAMNNTSPAVIIKYRPDIIFSMPVNLSRALTNWRVGR